MVGTLSGPRAGHDVTLRVVTGTDLRQTAIRALELIAEGHGRQLAPGIAALWTAGPLCGEIAEHFWEGGNAK